MTGHRRMPTKLQRPTVRTTDEKAREEFWPRYLQVIRYVSKTPGLAIPTEESFRTEIGPGLPTGDGDWPLADARRARRVHPSGHKPTAQTTEGRR
jgi:hypothetical protein